MVDCCELLKRYDTDKDGKISREEFIRAYDDWMAGKITREEFLIVYEAWMAGSINAVCPGCYPETTATVTIATTPPGAEVYIDGEYKGTT
jgi:hypothetical protein